ncbi:MAG: hypothetical protein EON87_17140 [Brevundimonas sp.]|nr:MAG: hypothetical protein EON87_17140 [Brevundimonas sp.]
MSAKVHLISGCANRDVADDAEEVSRCGLQLVWSIGPAPAEPSHDDYGEPHRIWAYTQPGQTRVLAASHDRGAVTCGKCQSSLVRSWGIN